MEYDLIIIGAGPAGITAGIYAARQKLNTLLITKSFGGQVARKAVAIENYPGFEEISGLELIQRFEKHLRKHKIEIVRDSVTKIEKINKKFLVFIKGKPKFQSKAVIVASGADPRPLELPGEKKFIGKGVSYCTACDAALFKNKTVAVIGGGNAGFEAAIFLAKYAKKIYILESAPQVRATPINQERVKKIKKIKVITNAILKKIKGKEFVDSIVYQNQKTKKIKTLSLEGVFIEIGSQPAVSFVKSLVEFNEKNEIKVNPSTLQTKTPGFFAAGDVSDGKYKQIVIAAGQGAIAILSAYDYLQKLK
ncbi:MAG: FAD-dependent oxidoreductase [Patescibacteria group bacterium]|nr:FAD-dependent oxidoreductase [Patescibacteria group bacterium]